MALVQINYSLRSKISDWICIYFGTEGVLSAATELDSYLMHVGINYENQGRQLDHVKKNKR